MAVVYIASSLAQYAEGERFVALEGSTVGEVLRELNDRYPGFRDRVFERNGGLKPHVSLFLNNKHFTDGSDLRTSVGEEDEISIISAIAGG